MNMKSGCKCVTELMEKINEYRQGDRLMIGKTGNVNVSFFKKSNPDKKYLNLSVGGDNGCSVFDLFACVVLAATFFSFVKCIANAVFGCASNE